MLSILMKNVEMIPFHSCWEWSGNRKPSGYGRVSINKSTYLAHRLSWIIHNGPINDGLFVCHKCDNPGCVNPEHLFLGTHTDNMKDRNSKGRSNMPKGVLHHKSKVNPEQINEIRQSSLSSRKLAEIYKISHHSILCIKRKETWRSV